MSELSAKHKALNILQVLSTDKGRRIKTSPRPDLTSSQEILAEKYRELADLLAAQHVERKTVDRLRSLDLVSRSPRCNPLPRRQCYHDNQVKSVRRRRKKGTANPEPDQIPKIVGLTSSKVQNKDDSQLHPDLEQPPISPPMSKKTVSFSDEKLISVSDTELIRRILRSPRKVALPEARPASSVGVRSHTVFPDKQSGKPKKKARKVKSPPKETPQINRSKSPQRASPETPRTKTEFHPSEDKLSSSDNPDILSWLREKNKLTRRQKRSERKKERQEKLVELKSAEEKLRRLAESEDKFSQWMKRKKDESLIRQQIERKVRKVVKQREALQSTEPNKESPVLATEPKTQRKGNVLNKTKSTKTKKTLPRQTKDVSEETRHLLLLNLEAEGLHAEEKRQKKEAEKGQRRLLREAQAVNTDNTNLKPFDTAKKAAHTLPTKTKSNDSSKTSDRTGDSEKSMPSSNPFKGLTYDDWLRQKQADQRRQAKEAKIQEVCDPDLEDLIPLLARRRIEQIKVRATRLDSGLRKSRDSPITSKMDRPRTPNGVRPYTFNTTTDEKPTGRMKPHPPTKSKRSDKTEASSEETKGPKLTSPMPDVVNFERPKPQDCEGTAHSPCRNPRTNQSGKAKSTDTDQSKQSVNNLKQPSASKDDKTKHGYQGEQTSAQTNSSADAIFMTEPNT